MIRNKAVLFDVDGVLLDTWDFVMGAFKYTLNLHGQPSPSKEILKKAMGMPLFEFYKTIFPDKNSHIMGQTHHNYQQDKFDLSKPFPKTKTILSKLKKKGYLIGAISNRTKISLQRSLKNAQIYKYFDVVLSAEDVVNPKPHPDHIHLALKKLKVKPNQAYMVGDTDVDILVGKNAGVKTVAVTYGFEGKEVAKYKPDFLIDDLEDLIKIIQNPFSYPRKKDQQSNLK